MFKNLPKLSEKNNIFFVPLEALAKWGVIAIGTIIWSLTMVKSGLTYSYGVGFWGPNGHDGVWHLSLINSLSQGRFDLPIFAGEMLKNYHIGFDLLLAVLHRVTFIPVSILYFQIFPPFCAFVIGWLVYRYIFQITKSPQSAWWATFCTSFGGSWGWLVSLVRTGSTGGESMFWSQQAISTLLNPPYALSLILLLLGLLSLSKPNFLTVLIFGSLASIKVYAGVIGLIGLGMLAISDRRLIKIWLASAGLSVLLYLPLNHNSGKLLIFQPFWFLETLMGLSDRLNWLHFYSAMVNYKLAHNYLKGIPAYSVALIIFILGNLGTRAIGLLSIKKSPLHIFTFSSLFFGILFPILFLQSGTPWNTIQFFYYAQFFLGLLAGVLVGNLKIKNNFAICTLHFALILITIPTTLDTLKHYLPNRPPAMISREELEALRFLSHLPRGTVLTYPVTVDPNSPAPRPLYLYESTAYVSAYSGQPVYLEDEVNLNILGYDWRSRREQSIGFFTTADLVFARQFLNHFNVSYIYLPRISTARPLLNSSQLGGSTIFENSQSAVWQITNPTQPQ